MIEEFIKVLDERIEGRKYKIKLKENKVKNGLVIEEEKLGKYGNLLIYSRRDKVGEGFGIRKVGMRIKLKDYIYGKEWNEYLEDYVSNCISKEYIEGIIVKIVRRINNGYYDYWYKVKLDSGKYKWCSYVKLIGGED